MKRIILLTKSMACVTQGFDWNLNATELGSNVQALFNVLVFCIACITTKVIYTLLKVYW